MKSTPRVGIQGTLILGLAITAMSCSQPETLSSVSSDALEYTGRLFILDESGACSFELQTSLPCWVGPGTNLNDMIAGFGTHTRLSWGGYLQRNGNCTFATDAWCTRSDWAHQVQCAETTAGWSLQNNDLVLVVQPDSLQYGCSSSIPTTVSLPGGGSAQIRAGFIGGSSGPYGGGGTSTHCGHQTGIGLHEVYEAATNGTSGDNCLYGCPPSTKFSSLTCNGYTYDAQLLSPAGATCSTAMAQRCVALHCNTSCATSFCGGPNGCGGTCGCPSGQYCDASGTCSSPNVPTCPSGSCGYRYGWCGIGAYCGSSGLIYADANTLYQCNSQGGPAQVINTCGGYQCIFRKGLDDVCAYGPPTCPVKGNGWYGSGLYCGLAQGMGYAEPYIVYYCSGPGAVASPNKTCSNNCVVAPNGYNDHC